jgi:hypothetical protein
MKLNMIIMEWLPMALIMLVSKFSLTHPRDLEFKRKK